jgi:hypothetical protein
MPIARPRFSLRRLMVVVAALGLNFGVVPWPACAVMGAGISLPLFISSGTFLEWVVAYSMIGVLAALSMPPVVTNCRRGRVAGPPAPLSAAAIPSAAPTCEGPDNAETPEL